MKTHTSTGGKRTGSANKAERRRTTTWWKLHCALSRSVSYSSLLCCRFVPSFLNCQHSPAALPGFRSWTADSWIHLTEDFSRFVLQWWVSPCSYCLNCLKILKPFDSRVCCCWKGKCISHRVFFTESQPDFKLLSQTGIGHKFEASNIHPSIKHWIVIMNIISLEVQQSWKRYPN